MRTSCTFKKLKYSIIKVLEVKKYSVKSNYFIIEILAEILKWFLYNKVISLKTKKFNTIPNGGFMILSFCLLLFLTLFIAIILIPKKEGYVLLFFSPIFVLAVLNYIYTKHANYLYISSQGIRHGKEELSWEEVYITMDYIGSRFIRNLFDYYFYFDSKYLTSAEIKSKDCQPEKN